VVTGIRGRTVEEDGICVIDSDAPSRGLIADISFRRRYWDYVGLAFFGIVFTG
jgi:hypothetical protein